MRVAIVGRSVTLGVPSHVPLGSRGCACSRARASRGVLVCSLICRQRSSRGRLKRRSCSCFGVRRRVLALRSCFQSCRTRVRNHLVAHPPPTCGMVAPAWVRAGRGGPCRSTPRPCRAGRGVWRVRAYCCTVKPAWHRASRLTTCCGCSRTASAAPCGVLPSQYMVLAPWPVGRAWVSACSRTYGAGSSRGELLPPW
jgi:hypothetical protein